MYPVTCYMTTSISLKAEVGEKEDEGDSPLQKTGNRSKEYMPCWLQVAKAWQKVYIVVFWSCR